MTNKKAQEEAEFDSPETIEGIKKALAKKGHQVELVETNVQAYGKLKKLKGKIDLVFNYSEGVAGQDREAQIPAMLESLQIPYTGSKPLTSAILLDKARTKEILAFNKIATPAWKLIRNTDLRKGSLDKLIKTALKSDGLNFPIFVKPNLEGSSKGIFNDSVVTDFKSLLKIAKRTIKEYQHGVLLENYLSGREFTVGMLKKGRVWQVLPIVEVGFGELPKGVRPIDSYEVKWIYDSPESNFDPLTCPAKISGTLKQEIEVICTKACEVLDIIDWCRIDLRLDKNGKPNILEINSPPGINPDPKENSRLPRAARVAGLSFPNLLDRVIHSATTRYKK
jgi:D-alanine-D-alanine ligase